MKSYKPSITILLVVLSMLAGCGLRDQVNDTQEDILELEAAVETTLQAKEETSQSIPILELPPDALEGLSSYRLDVNVDWTRSVPLTNEGSSQGYILRQTLTRQPDARLVYQLTSPGIEDWWVESNGGVWNCYDPYFETCTKYESVGYPLNHPLLAGIESILYEASQNAFSYIGEETIAGLATRHFSIKYRPLAEAVHWDDDHIDTIQNVSGEIWVVNQAGMPFFVVKAVIQWEGFMDGADGQGVYEYIVSEVNSVSMIALPQD